MQGKRENIKLKKWRRIGEEPRMREYCRRGQNRNSKMEIVRYQTEKSDIQILPPFKLHPWVNFDSEPSSSSISSKPPGGCLLLSGSHWGQGLGVGEECFQAHLDCWRNSVPCIHRIEVSISLLAVSRGLTQLLKIAHIPCHVIRSIFKPVKVCQILHELRISMASAFGTS